MQGLLNAGCDPTMEDMNQFMRKSSHFSRINQSRMRTSIDFKSTSFDHKKASNPVKEVTPRDMKSSELRSSIRVKTSPTKGLPLYTVAERGFTPKRAAVKEYSQLGRSSIQ
jgi:cellulose biosynthesis protein BcsQ